LLGKKKKINHLRNFLTSLQIMNTDLVKLRRPLVVVVEGIVGAGKTTLIHKCLQPLFESRGWRVTVIAEPVRGWKEDGLLELFYGDPHRYAYYFQTKAFHDRVKASQQQYQAHRDHTDVFLVERSVFSDRFFMNTLHKSGTITDLEYKHYQEWWSLWTEVVPFTPDLFVYLRPGLETCMERVHKRSRPGEHAITPDYQRQLLMEHDAYFLSDSGRVEITPQTSVACFVLSTDDDFTTKGQVQSDIYNDVATHLRLSVAC
jgi:deoxyadenosine/deoxycytidine kinase